MKVLLISKYLRNHKEFVEDFKKRNPDGRVVFLETEEGFELMIKNNISRVPVEIEYSEEIDKCLVSPKN